MTNIKLYQDILVGSSKIIKEKIVFDKHSYMVENMDKNLHS